VCIVVRAVVSRAYRGELVCGKVFIRAEVLRVLCGSPRWFYVLSTGVEWS
jgi:hypothetical protein